MSDNQKFCQLAPFTLAGSGVVIGASSIVLTTFAQIDGTLLTITDFGNKGFATLDPGNGSREEQISFSGVTQNANGTATLTGVKTVSFVAPYTETPNLTKSHAGGSIMVISNTAGFYNELASKNNDETITQTWTFTVPNYPQVDTPATLPTQLAQFTTKQYVDGIAIAGSPDATTTTKGISKVSVAPVAPTNPIVVGDNDTRVPTQSENDALVGTAGTPSSINKYVTNDDTTATPAVSKVVRFKANSKLDETGIALTTAGDLPYSDGADVQRLALGTLGQTLKSGTVAPQWVSQVLGSFTTNVSISNSTVETTLLTFSVPGNRMGANGIVSGEIVFLDFNLLNGQGATFRLKYGVTTVATMNMTNVVGSTAILIPKLNFYLVNKGLTNSQKGVLLLSGGKNVFQITGGSNSNSDGASLEADGTAAIDSTASQTLSITAQFGNASATNILDVVFGQAVLL